MYLNLLSGTIIKTSYPSTFEDFKLIVSIVMKWLSYELNFFGFSLSIFDVVLACIILSICITSIINILINK
jgi:hypothetical protein